MFELLMITRQAIDLICDLCRKANRLEYGFGDFEDGFRSHALRFALLLIVSDGEVADEELRSLSYLFDIEISGEAGKMTLISHVGENNVAEVMATIPAFLGGLVKIDQQHGTAMASSVVSCLETLALTVLKVDGHVDEAEIEVAMLHIGLLNNYLEANGLQRTKLSLLADLVPTVEERESLDDLLTEFRSLPIAPTTRTALDSFVNVLRVSQLRAAHGLPSVTITRNLSLIGSEAEIQKTVGELIHRVFSALGLVERKRLLALSMTSEQINPGSIAFELTKGTMLDRKAKTVMLTDITVSSGLERSKEAIGSMLWEFLVNRGEDASIILVGTEEGVQALMESEPRLGDYFRPPIEFHPPDNAGLAGLFLGWCERSGFELAEDARLFLVQNIDNLVALGGAKSTEHAVRILFEETVARQSNRVAQTGDFTREALVRIVPSDFIE